MSIRRMMLAIMSTFSDLVKSLIDDIKLRVLLAYGIFEAESCLQTQLDAINDINLLKDATIVITPNGYNENILHTVKGNTITAPPYNLASYTESTINWALAATTITTNSIVDPFGNTSNVMRVIETAATNNHRAGSTVFPAIFGRTYTFSIYLKKGIGATAPDIMQLYINNYSPTPFANYDINTGTVTASTNCTASITSASNGFWRCIMTVTSNVSITNASLQITFCNNNPASPLIPSYLGSTTSDVYFYALQVEESPSATTYQPVIFTPILEQGYAQHTRSTIGSRVESTGLVREVPQENLVNYSEDFIFWTALNSAILVPDIVDSNSPTGKYTTVQDNTLVATSVIRGTIPVSAVLQTLSFRAIIKKDTSGAIFNRISLGSTNDSNVTWNSVTGAFVTNLISANVTSFNTDYWEVTGTGIQTANLFVSIMPNVNNLANSAAGNAGLGTIGIAFFQIVLGNIVPTTYYPTKTRTNTPRIDYTDGSCPTLLLEGASANYVLRSNEFNNASWVKSNLTVTPNTDTAPNGILEADTLTATSNDGYITQNTVNFNSNNNRNASIYLKRKTGTGNVTIELLNTVLNVTINSSTWTRVNLNSVGLTGSWSGNGTTVTVVTTVPHNLITGDQVRYNAAALVQQIITVTVTGPTTFTFLASNTASPGSGTVYPQYFRLKFQTSGDEVYAWGAQFEYHPLNLQSGYYEPSSYIPTIAATVTRGNDITSLFKIRDNNLLNNTFSIFWEVKKIGGGASQDYHIGLTDNPGGFLLNYFIINGLPLGGRRGDNGVNLTLTGVAAYQPLSTNYYKGLITCNNGTFEVWIDGTKLSTSTMVNYDKLVALSLSGNNNGISRFKQVLGWNKVLNRAEIDLLFAYPYFNAGYTPVNNELQQIINRANAEGFTIPSTTILGYCDTLITEMKNDGVWNVSDVYFNFAYNDVTLSDWARINWMNPYGGLGIATTSGTVTYQTNGFQGNGTNGQLFTNVNLNRVSLNYTLNNAGRLAIVSVEATSTIKVIDSSGGFNANTLYNQFTNAHIINGGALSGAVDLSGIGLKSIMRDSSTSVRLQSLGVVSTIANNSTTIDVSNTQLFKNSSGYSNVCVSNYWIGASISNTQIQNFRTYYNTYLTNIGLTAFA